MTLSEENSAGEVTSKSTIRQQVFTEFDTLKLQKAWHSRRPKPRFPTVEEAMSKLAELPEYQNASTIITKTGNALKEVRLRALKDGKNLLVPVPLRSETGTLYVVKPPVNAEEDQLMKYVTRMGSHEKITVVQANDSWKADIVILGSVAVDKQGHRVGSGKDYCDLELALMTQKGMITKDTVIATIVHDIQVMETLPEVLFEEHDVCVGLIVTPTQIIRVSPPPSPPPGILWKLLTKSMLKLVPVLAELHDVDCKVDPNECKLKEETGERERRPRGRIFRRSKPRVEGDEPDQSQPNYRKSSRRRPKTNMQREQKSSGSGQEGDEEGGGGEDLAAPTRPGGQGRPRRPDRRRWWRNGDEKQNGFGKPRSKYGQRRREYQIDFSLCVRNLASDVRVRDLKNALAECHVKPAEIMWRGQDGYAVLHFAREGQEANDIPTSMDGMISCLRALKVSSSQEDGLVVEPYNRVTRIEVTDQVTSV